jgi:tRNA U38,U39,U40 pseudouridine synthase TruA
MAGNTNRMRQFKKHWTRLFLPCSTQKSVGRSTDTGVHAKQMYAHFDFETPFDVWV